MCTASLVHGRLETRGDECVCVCTSAKDLERKAVMSYGSSRENGETSSGTPRSAELNVRETGKTNNFYDELEDNPWGHTTVPCRDYVGCIHLIILS